MTLDKAAAAHLRLIVWCKDCRHQVEPDAAAMVERYGAEMSVPDLREWGRRGSAGTLRLSSYQRRNEAETAEQRTIKRRLQRGYGVKSQRFACIQSFEPRSTGS